MRSWLLRVMVPVVLLGACHEWPTQGGQGGAGGTGGTAGAGGSGGNVPFALTSTSYAEGDTIPTKYECVLATGGQNISPELSWTPGPAGTLSYAIVMRDLDLNITHWVMWDIPASTSSLPENVEGVYEPSVPAGAKQAALNASIVGYFGPCSADVVDTYEITVYAIPTATLDSLNQQTTPLAAAQAITNAAIAHASLSGES